METLKSWLVYHERRDRMLSSAPSRVSDPASKAAAGKILAERGSDNALTERISKTVLACYGVRTTRETLARSAEDAIAAAKAIGYPVVIKAESSAIPHKTEAGVVHLDLRSDEEVRAAYDDIHEKVKRLPQAPSFDGVLVQEMVKIDAEVLVGTHRDPQFGPIVVCGLGGIFVELLRDSVSALAPVTQPQAIAMLESLKGYPLLKGFRGSRAINITAMGEAIARISELAMDNVETISEMDVNPIVGSANDVVAVDALIITGPH